jgi:iron(III) transport system permease protein
MKGSVATRMTWSSWGFTGLVAAFLFTFMIYPLLYVFVRSFWIGGHLDFSFFGLMFQNPVLRRAIFNSLLIGTLTTTLTTLLALPLAYVFTNFSFRGKAFLQSFLLVPLILPPFVGAIGIKQLFARFGSVNLLLMKIGVMHQPLDWFGDGGLLCVVLLESLTFYPIMFLNLSAALANVDPSLEEAARCAGATRWETLRKVTLPLMLPGFFAGAVIVYIWSFTDLGTPLIFDFQVTIPVQIFSMVTDINENPMGYALVVLVILLTVTFFWTTKRLVGTRRYEMLSRGHVTGREKVARGPLTALFYVLVLLLISVALLPHLGVLLMSLSDQWFGTILPATFTLGYYQSIFTNAITSTSIRNSLFYSVCSTLLDVVFGLLIAWLLSRKRFPGRNLLDALIMLPLALPGIILAFGYVATFSGTFLDPRTNPTILLVFSYGLRRMPYMVRSAYAGFQQTSVTLEEAAQSLGATPMRTLRKITIPLITANLIAGMLLCFAYAMLEVSDSLILAMREEFYPITKAIYILSTSTSEGYSLACALGITGMVILTTAILVAGRILGKRMGELFRAG